MSVTTRFAPSPTGLLHVGNARVALVNWLFARGAGGRFVLRLDDTDRERSSDAYAAAIEVDLAWLGLDWDDYARQSERLERYAAAAERLKDAGRLYPCYETAEELAVRRKVLLSRGRPPIYDRAALKLEDADRRRLESEGRRPHWRFKLEHAPIAWDDLVRGAVSFDGTNLGDPVLLREDDRPLYTLSSVVDDIDLGISHVIRGEDHVSNTAAQVQIITALGGTVPGFAHLPLLADVSGKGLSKRLGSLSLQALRDDGLEPMAVNSLLARLGSSEPVEPRADLTALLAAFDIGHFGRATPKFDPQELATLNARVLQELPFEAVEERLRGLGIDTADAPFWNAVRPNLSRFEEVRNWWAVCHGPVAPVVEDANVLRSAADLLPPEPWDEATWAAWTGALKRSTGRSGKALFRPLRLALTGREHGPELKSLLPLIGRERAFARLTGHTA